MLVFFLTSVVYTTKRCKRRQRWNKNNTIARNEWQHVVTKIESNFCDFHLPKWKLNEGWERQKRKKYWSTLFCGHLTHSHWFFWCPLPNSTSFRVLTQFHALSLSNFSFFRPNAVFQLNLLWHFPQLLSFAVTFFLFAFSSSSSKTVWIYGVPSKCTSVNDVIHTINYMGEKRKWIFH